MLLMLVGMCWLLAVLLILCVCFTASERRSQSDPTTGSQGEPVTQKTVAIPRAPYERPRPALEHAATTLAQTAT